MFDQVRVSNSQSDQKLFFKAIHTNQYFTIVNDIANTFKFTINDPQNRVSCAPLTQTNTLDRAGALVIKCTALSYGNGGDGQIKINFNDQSETSIPYQIYQPVSNELFYQKAGSPEGFVNYSNTQSFSFNSCENQFCSYDQTTNALTDFTRMINDNYVKPLQLAQNLTDFENARQKIIDNEKIASSDDKKITKVIIIRKASTSTSLLAGQKALIQQLKTNTGFSDVQLLGLNDFQGCGYYKVSVQVPWIVTTPVQFQNRMSGIPLYIQITKLKGCDPILANSQILLEKFNGAGTDNRVSPLFYTGREVINYADFDITRFWKGLNLDTLQSLLDLREPVMLLGEYSNGDSIQDTNNAKLIDGIFYSQDLKQPISSRRFYDNGLCNQIEGSKLPGQIAYLSGAFAIGSLGTLLLTAGASVPFSAILGIAGTKLTTALTLCAATGAVPGLIKQNTCILYNDCLNTALLSGASVSSGILNPGVGTKGGTAVISDWAHSFSLKTGRGWAVDLGLTAAAVGGSLSSAEFKQFPTTGWKEGMQNQATSNYWTSNLPEFVTIAGIQVPKAFALRLKTTDAEALKKSLQDFGYQGQDLTDAMNTIQTSGLSAFVKTMKTQEQKTGFLAVQSARVKKTLSSLKQFGVSDAERTTFEKTIQDEIAKGSFATPQDLQNYISAQVDAHFPVTLTQADAIAALKSRLTPAEEAALSSDPTLQQQLLVDAKNLQQQVLIETENTKVKLTNDLVTQFSGKTTMQWVKSIGLTLLEGALIAKMVGFDVTPVRSELDYYGPSHIVVFSQANNSLPSSVEVCKDDSCINPTFLNCQNKDACFYTLTATQKSGLPPNNYNVLVVGLNTQSPLSTVQVINSVFNPTESIVDDKSLVINS
ncbi:Uncharacterised protein [uncultured archaeon]|nr:Uncharacterised protein [uncultured archaeon]